MSCELKTFAKVLELNKIKKFLFGDEKDENWLQKCVISLSPARDIFVIAYCNKMIVLESKWSNVPEDDVKITYHIVWHGIPDKCEKEMIKSVLCLPISTSKKRSRTQTTPDWTCLIVGFTSGFVRFYTEMGSLLLSQQLHDEPVLEIMSQSSLLSQYHNKAEKNEDIHILYKSVVCSIIGFVLLNTLNACRNQFARVQANSTDNSLAPPLTYKKWAFSNQENIHGCAVAGPVPANMFDHLFTASLCGGFNVKYQNNPPHCQLYVAAGQKPFVGFHYAFENETQPIISELTKAVATKLKSAFEQSVPNWLLGGIRPNTRQNEVRMEPAEEMGFSGTELKRTAGSIFMIKVSKENSHHVDVPSEEKQFGLLDEERLGTSILMSPLGDIAAVTDNFGRISIVDLTFGIIVRMLKGFRDAHCGWLLVEEEVDRPETRKRRVEFLVICVPKKGIVEIWTMQFGPKVTTFNVKKDGRLLNSNYGIIGLYDGRNFHNSCVYMESTGEMKDITVPFYCCLSTKNNDKARDIHMLKNMLKILKDEHDSLDKLIQESINLAQHLKTSEVIKKGVESLSSNKYISSDVLITFLETLKERLSLETDLLENDDEFYLHLECIERLTKLFKFCDDMYQLPPDYSSVANEPDYLIQSACDILLVKEEELDKLMALLPSSRNKQKRVAFAEDLSTNGGFATFLSSFEKHSSLKLHSNISLKALEFVCDSLCSGVMYGKCDLRTWKNECEKSQLTQSDLLFLIFHYWLYKPLSITMVREMLNLHKIINAALSIYKADEAKTNWQKVRSQLANSECPLTSITAAIVCRAISCKQNIVLNARNSEENVEEKCDKEVDLCSNLDWENVTAEDCDWNILISQLEDITFLDSALKYMPKQLPATLFCVPYEFPNVVLSSILKQGKGSISEYVARWIISLGLNPELLLSADFNSLNSEKGVEKSSPKKYLLGDVQEGTVISVDPCSEAKPIKPNEKEILDLLEKLTATFPYSLNCNSLLVNMTWEYVLTWKKEINDLRPLEAAITTLKFIRCPHVKHGCCVLIWSSHLSMICESACRLVNKVGKLPKNRLCQQDIGISEENLNRFLNLWVQFMDIFIEAGFEMDVVPKSEFKYEPLWDGHGFSPRNSTPPLTELAAKQKPSNQDLLYLLSQCARTLYFLTSFPLRMTHPIDSLFPSSSAEMLFTLIQSNETFYHSNPDEKIIVNRCSFLKKLISRVINEILKPYVEPPKTLGADYVDKLKPSVDWMNRIFDLAHDWTVPTDTLKRHQICELYNNGYDRIAEEIISCVNEKDQLGHQLLPILGLRIKTILNMNVDYYSDFSPSVTTWIDSLHDQLSNTEISISDALQFAKVIHNLIPEGGKDKNQINNVLESLEAINERTDLY